MSWPLECKGIARGAAVKGRAKLNCVELLYRTESDPPTYDTEDMLLFRTIVKLSGPSSFKLHQSRSPLATRKTWGTSARFGLVSSSEGDVK